MEKTHKNDVYKMSYSPKEIKKIKEKLKNDEELKISL